VSKVRVLDASAVLALLQLEKVRERVEAALDAGPCLMTAVNACEVLGKLHEKGMPIEEAQASLDDLRLTVVDFDAELARLAAGLRVRTKSIGASLGDRACLALAERESRRGDAPEVLTAERAWTGLKWPFKVVAIR
jgi:ribonuclease VapC